jgi:hypothetical protein
MAKTAPNGESLKSSIQNHNINKTIETNHLDFSLTTTIFDLYEKDQ